MHYAVTRIRCNASLYFIHLRIHFACLPFRKYCYDSVRISINVSLLMCINIIVRLLLELNVEIEHDFFVYLQFLIRKVHDAWKKFNLHSWNQNIIERNWITTTSSIRAVSVSPERIYHHIICMDALFNTHLSHSTHILYQHSRPIWHVCMGSSITCANSNCIKYG